MKWRKEPERLKPGAPNVLIVLIDDVGFGVPDTFGGEVHTPTLSRLRDAGISYNAFHTTSICSPSRAALLTGRNHHRVGNGTIAERASDFDGYTGIIPKTSATIAETLHHYGYKSAAFGKWHNTPANQTTAMGPFDRWPTGHGFDYFYGFLAGETSQWEPRLYENLNAIEPPHSEKYHLTEDMVDKGLAWIKRHQAFSPDKPFLMYWAPGARARPAPHLPGVGRQVQRQVRRRLGQVPRASLPAPEGTRLDPGGREADAASRHDGVVGQHPRSGAAVPAAADGGVRRFRRAHRRAGRQARGRAGTTRLRDNTIILYIWGDNGSSAEGQKGSISELLAQNNIPNTIEQQMAALDERRRTAGPGRAQGRQHVPCRLGVGRQHPVPVHQARRRALRRHAQPDGRLLAEGDQAGQDAAVAVPPRQRHRANPLRSDRHQAPRGSERVQAGPDGRREHGVHLRRRQGSGPEEDAVFREQRQPRHLPRRLVRLHLRAVRPVGYAEHRRAIEGMGREQGRVGVVRPVQGLLAGRTTSPPRSPNGWRG